MMALLKLKSAHWALLAALALAPTAALAHQEEVSEDPASPGQAEAEAVQTQAEGTGAEEAEAETDAVATEETQAEAGSGEAPAAGPEGDAGVQPPADAGPKVISGMSILGNQEAPTSLVIVPWKGSEIGNPVGISTMLDDSRQPVDKEVFMRELRYYQIRSETGP